MPNIANELRAKAAAMRADAEKLLAAAAVLDSAEHLGEASAQTPPARSAPEAQGIAPDGKAITAAVRAVSNKGEFGLPSVVNELVNRGYQVSPEIRARTSTVLNRMEKAEEIVKVVQGSGSMPNVYAKKEAEKG